MSWMVSEARRRAMSILRTLLAMRPIIAIRVLPRPYPHSTGLWADRGVPIAVSTAAPNTATRVPAVRESWGDAPGG